MTFIAHLPEKFVGQDFSIDCYDIEIPGTENSPKPMFKGPGVIEGRLGQCWQQISGSPSGLPRVYVSGIKALKPSHYLHTELMSRKTARDIKILNVCDLLEKGLFLLVFQGKYMIYYIACIQL